MTATSSNYATLLAYLNESLLGRGYPGPLFMGSDALAMGDTDKALVVNCLYKVFVDMQNYREDKVAFAEEQTKLQHENKALKVPPSPPRLLNVDTSLINLLLSGSAGQVQGHGRPL
jgi:hypothetical protein